MSYFNVQWAKSHTEVDTQRLLPSTFKNLSTQVRYSNRIVFLCKISLENVVKNKYFHPVIFHGKYEPLCT